MGLLTVAGEWKKLGSTHIPELLILFCGGLSTSGYRGDNDKRYLVAHRCTFIKLTSR